MLRGTEAEQAIDHIVLADVADGDGPLERDHRHDHRFAGSQAHGIISGTREAATQQKLGPGRSRRLVTVHASKVCLLAH